MSLHLKTPLIESHSLSSRLGKNVLLKLEALQPPGSFKIRGIGALCEQLKAKGVSQFVSSSGGNAGIAVAYAGRQLGIPVTVVVPQTTTERAQTIIKSFGAEVLVHGSSWKEANEKAETIARESGALVHPFDHPVLWTGYASMIDEVVGSGVHPDAVIVSVGGGGLYSGVVEGLRRNGLTSTPVIAVETEGTASFHAAINQGQLVELEAITGVATTLGAKRVASHAFELQKIHPTVSVVVSDGHAVSRVRPIPGRPPTIGRASVWRRFGYDLRQPSRARALHNDRVHCVRRRVRDRRTAQRIFTIHILSMINHPTHLSLGIDIGTTKVAVAIVDTKTRRAIATSSIPHEGDLPGTVRGRSEQSVSRILGALDRCVDQLPLHLRHLVSSIGVTGQMHGVVLWNTDSGEVSHLVTWQDQRCLENNFLTELRAATGDSTAQSGYGTSTLAWLAANEPATLSRFSAAATIHDYLVALLTGTFTPMTDPSDAASFGFFDLASRVWREDYIAKASIPRHLLPQIRSAGEHVGPLSKEYSDRWGLPTDVPIGNALGDNQASLYGSLTNAATQVALTIGTGAQLSVVVPTLPKDYAAGSSRFEFRPYVGGSYIATVASLTGGRALATLGRALESFMRELGIENRPSVDTIQTAMHKAGLERATTDLRAKASLSGERHDLSLRGSFTNLSFDNFTIGDMTAALCYGLVTSLRDGLPGEFLQARTEIVGSGNAICRSPLMQRVIRESFGCDLTLQEGAETTACGAALVAADSP